MKRRIFLISLLLLLGTRAHAGPLEDGAFMVGVNLGELPWGGSFKPGLMLGYQWNDYVYTGVTYQIGDSIRRDEGSFNATGFGLDGLMTSEEDVSPRAMASVRLRPHRLAPFATLGLVYNGRDTETSTYSDGTTVVQSRPPAWRPALGLGYEYTFDGGVSMHVEWAGWVFERPAPDVSVSGGARSPAAEAGLRQRINDNFKEQVTNRYHMFSMGVGYAF